MDSRPLQVSAVVDGDQSVGEGREGKAWEAFNASRAWLALEDPDDRQGVGAEQPIKVCKLPMPELDDVGREVDHSRRTCRIPNHRPARLDALSPATGE